MAEKFVLISALEKFDQGDSFENNDWPLHVTVMPWFSLPKQLESDFVDVTESHMHGVDPMMVIGDANEWFEPNQSVRVRTLRHIGQLASLHVNMLAIVTRHGGEVDSTFIRDDYRPHVTYQQKRGITQDQKITLSRMQLIRGDVDGPRAVEKVFHFGGELRA